MIASRVAAGTLTVTHETVPPEEAPGAWARSSSGGTDLRPVVVP
jgi:hypothetical protein